VHVAEPLARAEADDLSLQDAEKLDLSNLQ
jgi:hypothetical protein